jgi:hypothetical protein
MPNHGYYRASQETLSTISQTLEGKPWGEIDIAAFLKANDELEIPVLSLLKRRMVQKGTALLQAISVSSEELSTLDSRWDSPQRKLSSRIREAESDEDQALNDAAARLRTALLKGQGTAQTQLPYEEEIKFGKMQVGLARAPKKEGQTTPTIAEDLETIGATPLIADIEKRTQEFEAALAQVPPEARNASRSARIKLATTDLVDELSHSHDELQRQIEAANAPETKDRLTKLLAVLQNLIPAPPSSVVIPATPEPSEKL